MKPSQPAVRISLLLAIWTALIGALLIPAAALAQDVQVNSADPATAPQGTVNLNVTIKGKGFKNGAQAKWFVTGTTNPGGVTVNSTAFVSPSELRANITIADDAEIAAFDIVVTNSNGRSGKGTELFRVSEKLAPNASLFVNVTSTVHDYTDATQTQLTLLRSDNFNASTQASYSVADFNAISRVNSENGNGDWDLDLREQTSRKVFLTFSSPAGGSPASPVPDGYYNARVISRCYDANNNITATSGFFHTLPGTSNNRCALRVLFNHNGTDYIFVMSPIQPETGWATVSCNAGNGAGQCVNWTVVPNTTSPASQGNLATVAKLYYIAKNKKQVLVGSYHKTYRIDVTNP